jgi:hypothetical protein
MIEIKLAAQRILGLRESDCKTSSEEHNTRNWSKGESKAKSYALRRATKLNAMHGGRLDAELELLEETPPAMLWELLLKDWANPQEWAISID